MAQLTYLQAISNALRDEMRRDPNVFVLGEDIGVFGGAFKITHGFLENKFLYRHYREEVPDGDYVVPIGIAALRTRGENLSIISYGAAVHLCVEVARTLEKEGGSVEVVDLRSLVPLDRETVLESVKKTGKALIVHEANITAGFAADIAALIAQEAFEYLDAPVMRVASLDVPVPFSPPLEMAMLPSVDKVAAAARQLLSY